ncbi:hypothetical protein QBR50_19910, partial [Acinetobacter baumannii]|nr:hypothetical protein [Acinetobacter baumannii]
MCDSHMVMLWAPQRHRGLPQPDDGHTSTDTHPTDAPAPRTARHKQTRCAASPTHPPSVVPPDT